MVTYQINRHTGERQISAAYDQPSDSSLEDLAIILAAYFINYPVETGSLSE